MNITICFLICTSVILVPHCILGRREKLNIKKQESAIINGREAKRGARPYFVALSLKGYGTFCGGSIISPRYILTAAHCLPPKQINTDNIHILVGALNANHPGTPYKPSKLIIHKNYNDKTLANDIALVQVEKPIQFNQEASKINLPDSNIKINDGDTVTLVGFGKTEKGKAKSLQEADLTVANQEDCKKKFDQPKQKLVLDTNICIKFQKKNGKRVDSCYGDSGGGGILNGTVISLVSFGNKGKECNKGDNPTVHTRVSKYLDWIKENTK